jgi:hypothetical protein
LVTSGRQADVFPARDDATCRHRRSRGHSPHLTPIKDIADPSAGLD